MVQKGDLIVYGNTGICRVEEVGTPESLPGVDKEKLYYKLVPVRSASTIYTPVDTSVFMRPVMTKEAADHLIDRIPEISEDSFECRDPRMLAEHYRTSLQTHECEDLIRLIKTVYRKSKKLVQNGKKPGKTDQQYRKRAEELLHEELSVALGISFDEVPAYIEQRISALEVAQGA